MPSFFRIIFNRALTDVALLLALAALFPACKGESGGGGNGSGGEAGNGAGGSGGGAPAVPFQALPPAVYAGKVKNLLTGLPLDESERAQVVADGKSLPGLIDAWMALPEWRIKTLDFFQQAFQQTQTDLADYDEHLGVTTQQWGRTDRARFVQSAESSFARTAMNVVDSGKPFTDTVTSNQFMLNPPLMALYAWVDAWPRNDALRPVPQAIWLYAKYQDRLKFERTTEVIPIAQSVDPTSPNFLRWTDPNCVEVTTNPGQAMNGTLDFIFGGNPGNRCAPPGSQWTEADWNDWRLVTVRAPRAGEERTAFWDLPRFRDPKTTELISALPRVGFMSTPAFFANWPTNDSNSYRVTTNQALIVALGRSFDDAGTTVTVSETSVDMLHITPGTACYGCHSTLDPMRDFFLQSYGLAYSAQLDAAKLQVQGTFTVDDSAPVTGVGIAAFAQAAAAHPSFAPAWTQKLCQYANSARCEEDDPEFLRVAEAWKKSQFNWKTLVRTLFSSPLVTFAARTKTSDADGMVVSIARREALCTALSHRLNTPDLCSLATPSELLGRRSPVARNLALSVPGAGYARGDDKPLLPRDPSLFFVSATENLCTLVASQLIDAGAAPRYTSANKDAAISDFVATLMGLPSGDGRAAPVKTVLDEHHAEALAAGASAAEALRSTFTLACASPLGISSGL